MSDLVAFTRSFHCDSASAQLNQFKTTTSMNGPTAT
nr:MAG: hypothetical protein [Apis mellifera filamentous virus]WOK43407.1 MAG: hypothetical protein [Apis mellifera filamentous virus]